MRIDDSYVAEPGVAELTDRQFRVWIRLLSHCARYSRPTVNAATQRELSGLGPKTIERFVSLGLLDEVGPELYEVPDWSRFQLGDPTAAERQRRHRAGGAQRGREADQ